MGQRGFSAVQAGIVLAIIAAIVGAQAMVYQQGYGRGAADKQVEWDTADREAQDEVNDLRAAVAAAVLDKDEAARMSEETASDSETEWRRKVRDAERKGIALGSCEPAASGGAVAADSTWPALGGAGSGLRPPVDTDGAVDRAAPRIRLSWQFVHDVDAAWTGLDGKPVSSLAAGSPWPAGAGAGSPYYLEDARDAGGENALRCSKDRREFDALIMRLKAAADAVDRTRQ